MTHAILFSPYKLFKMVARSELTRIWLQEANNTYQEAEYQLRYMANVWYTPFAH